MNPRNPHRRIRRSLLLAVSCVAGTLLLGVPAAYALARSRSRWVRTFEELLTLPVAVPGLATALALILVYGQMRGFRGSFAFILAGHLVFTLPFMVRTVAAAFARQLALLGQLLAHQLALERREVVDEDLAGQVVHLVLDAHREQAVGIEFVRLAIAADRTHLDRVRARQQHR